VLVQLPWLGTELSTGGGWAYAVPDGGTVPPFSTGTFDVVFDARSLYQVGDYTAELSFSGNFDNIVPTMPLTMHLDCPTCGFLDGDITDITTGDPLSADVHVTSAAGFDVTVTGESYSLAVPADTYDITVSASGYLSDTATVVVTQGSTTTTDFALWPIFSELAYMPDFFEATVGLGGVVTQTMTISNPGTVAFDFSLADVETGNPFGMNLRAPETVCPPDAFGYSCTDSTEPDGLVTYNFEDISGTGTSVSLSDDEVSGPIPVGFAFNYYGTDYNDVYISSNGFLTVLPGQYNGCCSGQPMPTAGNPDGVIAGAWNDLYPPGGGSITYQTMGTAPFRYMIVQYTDITHYPGGGFPITFQFKLFEGSNNIEVHYMDAPSDGSNQSAGIENQNGTVGLQYYYGTGNTGQSVAVCYLYPGQFSCGSGGSDAPWLIETPDSGTVAGFGGTMDVNIVFDATGITQTGTYTANIFFSGTFDNAVMPATAVLHVEDVAYGLEMSGDMAASGAPGEMVMYTMTITNTGNVADTFNLVATGHDWTTTLSNSSVSLGVGQVATVMVHVTIPTGATNGETDTTTVTVTSVGDPGINGTADMTTTAVVPPPPTYTLFLPIILKP
jgi:hypothetical protein